MSRLTNWLDTQHPKIVKSLTPLKDKDILHISTNRFIKEMIPRISTRTIANEDMSMPRICGSESVVGCIYGHGAVGQTTYDHIFKDQVNCEKFKTPIFWIYRINIDECVRPTKKLLPDVSKTKELWVVPYAPEAISVKPELIGALIPETITEVITGGESKENTYFYLQLSVPAMLDDKVIDIGCYNFMLEGSLTNNIEYPRSDVKDFKEISVSKFKTVLNNLKK